jgi:hypothetical protein
MVALASDRNRQISISFRLHRFHDGRILRLTEASNERCRCRAMTEMSIGTAKKTPKGVHIQAQKAIARKSRKGLSVCRLPDLRTAQHSGHSVTEISIGGGNLDCLEARARTVRSPRAIDVVENGVHKAICSAISERPGFLGTTLLVAKHVS